MPDYAPTFLEAERWRVIQPSIDPESAKNKELSSQELDAQLGQIGLTPSEEHPPSPTSLGRVIQDVPLRAGAPVLLQVSRWDPLKDMAGVLELFVTHVAEQTGAHLVLAGPDPSDIPDDPEGHAVFAELLNSYERVPSPVRAQIHLVLLSLRDTDSNALIVNALQRRATVVIQKSLEEGFGLTITEAMWKGRPVVASQVGGIPSQINTDEVGVLIDDPADLQGFGYAVVSLLKEPNRAERIGLAAQHRCTTAFMVDRELCDYFDLYLSLLRDG
jgi:trehalose synthase